MTLAIDHVEVLRKAKKFLAWHAERARYKITTRDEELSNLSTCQTTVAEKHYTPSELARVWGVSVETIRSIFRNESGVLKIGKNGTKFRRGYFTLRIPESVAVRVHTRLSA